MALLNVTWLAPATLPRFVEGLITMTCTRRVREATRCRDGRSWDAIRTAYLHVHCQLLYQSQEATRMKGVRMLVWLLDIVLRAPNMPASAVSPSDQSIDTLSNHS
jgi:hypothetical protein